MRGEEGWEWEDGREKGRGERARSPPSRSRAQRPCQLGHANSAMLNGF